MTLSTDFQIIPRHLTSLLSGLFLGFLMTAVTVPVNGSSYYQRGYNALAHYGVGASLGQHKVYLASNYGGSYYRGYYSRRVIINRSYPRYYYKPRSYYVPRYYPYGVYYQRVYPRYYRGYGVFYYKKPYFGKRNDYRSRYYYRYRR